MRVDGVCSHQSVSKTDKEGNGRNESSQSPAAVVQET